MHLGLRIDRLAQITVGGAGTRWIGIGRGRHRRDLGARVRPESQYTAMQGGRHAGVVDVVAHHLYLLARQQAHRAVDADTGGGARQALLVDRVTEQRDVAARRTDGAGIGDGTAVLDFHQQAAQIRIAVGRGEINLVLGGRRDDLATGCFERAAVVD